MENRRLTAWAPLLLVIGAACSGTASEQSAPPTGTTPPKSNPPGGTSPGTNPSTNPPAMMPLPYEALSPRVYAAKVKTLLTGLALTDDELKAITADANALPRLIDGWVARDEWRAKMLEFFKQAFQQTQTDPNDYDEQLGRTTNPWQAQDKLRWLRSAEESFARTVLQLIDEGAPFTQVVTTDRFMLNVPLMAEYAFIDTFPQDDMDKPVAAGMWLLRKFPQITFVRTTDPVAFADTINPASPSFMHFYEPMPYAGMNVNCREPQMKKGAAAFPYIVDMLHGGRPGCGSTTPIFTQQDYDGWRMVRIRAPRAGEERTTFWDVPKLRDPATTELVLGTPRVGFMSTPAFFANWPTNASNSYRVTTNQALIVGLNRSFDDKNTTIQVSETTSDAMHVQPGTACFGCHSTLDPMRDMFRQSFSIAYSLQLDPMRGGAPAVGTFSVDGVTTMGTGLASFAKAMATHPRFATAWTQKLCQFANSISCSEDDPEFVRVANVFKSSNFNFKVLTRELFSSPLVTFARPTKTATDQGVVVGIARRETMCAALANRLGAPDLCALAEGQAQAAAGATRATAAILRNLALSVPGAGYVRGNEVPLMPHDPSLFYSSASENLCWVLATQLVDNGKTSRYASARKDDAIRDFVTTVMGVPPSDARGAEMTAILTDHHTAALGTPGATPTDALRSTFTLACESPLATSLGL